MTAIHPTAVVDPAARIAEEASIGPYCIVGPDVTIGPGCRLESQVNVTGHTEIGARTRIGAFTSLGTPPQSFRYRGGPTRLVIGSDCDLRESVTMNRGTEDGGGITVVGDRCMFMANSHVAHDCRVGSGVVFANCATLGGHSVIGDNVVIGGMAATHQFTRVGSNAMISGMSGVRGDVIPYGLASGDVARLAGLNIIGMKRRSVPRASIHAARRAFRTLFLGEERFPRRVEAAEAEANGDPVVAEIIGFIRAAAERPLLSARRLVKG